ncbi:MAG: HlyD family type I secretion periplasmic adaptor subunit [Hyphomicrobiaceae bacterium]|nr:HlyD family type I secretion periplasmic adaptor subunit [Hyphomicrobiaceae bacterium]
MRTVAGLVLGLAAWLLLASISGAVMAPGKVTVESSYQTVQHLDGGIVAEIRVRNGDQVRAGDVLLRLDGTRASADLAIARSRVRELSIQEARLEAERDRREAFARPSGLDDDEETSRIQAAQKTLFAARRTGHLGERALLVERRGQLEGEVRGIEAQLSSSRKQADLVVRELTALRPLYEKGFVNRQRMLPIEREAARLEGETGRLSSDLAKAQGAVMEVDLRIAQLEKTFTTEVVDELRKVQAQLAEARASERTYVDRLARIEIRAPRSGRVHALSLQTVGGVISPASPILQVIPEDERLIVTAEMKTQDVDKVRAGQVATIRFPALDSATTPRLEGSVIRVSPAELVDKSGRSYFSADVEIAARELARLSSGHMLLPGMPAEVYFETGSRSMLSYLVKPLADALSHAFRDG